MSNGCCKRYVSVRMAPEYKDSPTLISLELCSSEGLPMQSKVVSTRGRETNPGWRRQEKAMEARMMVLSLGSDNLKYINGILLDDKKTNASNGMAMEVMDCPPLMSSSHAAFLINHDAALRIIVIIQMNVIVA